MICNWTYSRDMFRKLDELQSVYNELRFYVDNFVIAKGGSLLQLLIYAYHLQPENVLLCLSDKETLIKVCCH